VSHTYAQNVIHAVFSSKDRRKLMPSEFRPRLISDTPPAFIESESGYMRVRIGKR